MRSGQDAAFWILVAIALLGSALAVVSAASKEPVTIIFGLVLAIGIPLDLKFKWSSRLDKSRSTGKEERQ